MKSNVINIVTATIFVFIFSSCSSVPTQEQINSAYYGDYSNNYEDIVKSFMRTILKDPASATYDFNAIPSKGWAGGGIWGSAEFGYRICAYINAKNSFGGYVGAKRYFFIIRDNRVVKYIDAEMAAEKMCSNM